MLRSFCKQLSISATAIVDVVGVVVVVGYICCAALLEMFPHDSPDLVNILLQTASLSKCSLRAELT